MFDINRYLKKRSQRLIQVQECKEKLGGKCVICGTTENLEFDHIDPKTKEFAISQARSVSQERLDVELKKCQLLCYGCHRHKSVQNGDQYETQHGDFSMYARHKCRCKSCVDAHRKRCRDYYQKNKDEINKRRREKRKVSG